MVAQQFKSEDEFETDDCTYGKDLSKENSILEHLTHKVSKVYPEGILLSEKHKRQIEIISSNHEIAAVIYGETGTGKEEIAKLIHKLRSESKKCHLVSVNCANLTNDLASSLLFGHSRGSFTGAEKSTKGLIGEANGGILFLDEIHTLSKDNQTKLLRVLNDGKYSRIGETTERSSKFQLVAASSKDLYEEVEAGNFLLDLKIRIMGIDIHLLPLRERLQDLPDLISLFLVKHNVSISHNEFSMLVDRCSKFHWQGNIRQLFKVLHTWIISCSYEKSGLKASSMPICRSMQPPRESEKLTKDEIPNNPLHNLNILYEEVLPLLERIRDEKPLKEVVEELEKLVLKKTIQKHRKLADVYKKLEISRSTLDSKRKKYGL